MRTTDGGSKAATDARGAGEALSPERGFTRADFDPDKLQHPYFLDSDLGLW
jgi:hypothetical protein